MNQHMACLTGSIALGLFCANAGAGPQSPPTIDVEFFDGETRDLALPTTPGPNPANERIWTAQSGHCRAAYRLSDKRRMMRETVLFPDASAAAFESAQAVELDESHRLLYTVTNQALYCEDVTNPALPAGQVRFAASSLPSGLGAGGFQDVKVDPLTGTVFVLTPTHLVALSGGPGVPAFLGGTALSISAKLGIPAGCNTTLKGNRFVDFEVRRVPGGPFLVAALVQLDPIPGAAGRAGPRIVVFGDLDEANGFANPRFNFGTVGAPNYAYWNPQLCCPELFGNAACEALTYSVKDLDLSVEGAQLYLYASGNANLGVARVDITNVLSTGSVGTDQRRLLPLQTPSSPPPEPVYYVRASRATPAHAYAIATSGCYAVDFNAGTVTPLAEDCGAPGLQDSVLRGTSASTEELWIGINHSIDFTFKVFGVGGSAPALSARWPAIWHNDGGVALQDTANPGSISVFMPTYGGVLAYRSSTGVTGTWNIPAAGYQPAQEVGLGRSLTEHIDISDAFDAGHGHPAHVFTADGQGGFHDYALDAQANPLSPLQNSITNYAVFAPGTWNPPYDPLTNPGGDHYYGNDVLYVPDLNGSGRSFVLTDIVNRTRMQGALIGWEWNGVSARWDLRAARVVDLCPSITDPRCVTDGVFFTNTIHLARGTAGSDFAFVGHTFGAWEFDLGPLTAASPSILTVDHVEVLGTDAKSLSSFNQNTCFGVATSQDTLFIGFQNENSAPRAQVSTFAWDSGTGAITHAAVVIVDNGATGANDPTWQGTFRLRYHETNPGTGDGRVYVCGSSGQVLELDHTGGGTQSLAILSRWKSTWSGPIQDVKFYEFTPGVTQMLISKDADSFAIVTLH